MGQQITVTGIVLSATNISEYDKRVVILTKERGKIAAFARGARKMNSPFLAACQPFVYGEFTVFSGKTYSINNVEVKDFFAELRQDMAELYLGFYFCEMADYFTVEGNDELKIMKLLYVTLLALRKRKVPKELIRIIYEIKITAYFGLMMEASQCSLCRNHETPLLYFSSTRGGVICESCKSKVPDAIYIQESTLYALQYILSQPVQKLYTFTVSDTVLRQLIKISHSYLAHHVEHRFKSAEFLDLSI